jgi:hypothetical protein
MVVSAYTYGQSFRRLAMSNDGSGYLDKLKAKIAQLQAEIKKAKLAANAIAEIDGAPCPYPGADDDAEVVVTSFHSDDFYGQPLATCVRRILEARKATGPGPATVADIHDALVAGGYAFDTKDEATAKNSLRTSLGKNPQFHKLPTGTWGLIAWYPKARNKPNENGKDENANTQATTG